MKLKYKMIFRPLGDSFIGVPVGKDARLSDAIITVDEVGYDIVNLLEQPLDRKSLVEKMLDIYETDFETMAPCVDAMVGVLRNEGLLTEQEDCL